MPDPHSSRVYKFKEVLNDLISYFLLGDLISLKNYKDLHHLPDDLATEFTTYESGDNAVKEGILIPLAGIENYPYTIIFNLSGETPELLKTDSELQIRESGYILKIESETLHLFTWRALNNFKESTIEEFTQNKPHISLENGWYTLEILGGQTLQDSIINEKGENLIIRESEPTLEFILSKTKEKKECTADIFRSYTLKSNSY
ncbi:hypothetical protein [Chryseobacterium sp.]|uniref:hypothetical protein n=1 Tax=Chryseobacterium sp. TaxID=1871047 RepID=UPI0025C21C2C|nr:hypothetical protein [Chryseobacterium sp.]